MVVAVVEGGRCRRRRDSNGRIGGVVMSGAAREWRWSTEIGQGKSSSRRRWALVALGEEAEGIDLVDEVGHAGPTAQPESHHQHPPDHEHVQQVGSDPTSGEPRRRLDGVLQALIYFSTIWLFYLNYNGIRNEEKRYLASFGGTEGEHVGEGGDDVDGEAN